MNKNFFAGLFVGLGLLGIFAFRPAEQDKHLAIQKWEYKVVTKPFNPMAKTIEAAMQALGAEGWEFVAFTDYYIYKRPIE